MNARLLSLKSIVLAVMLLGATAAHADIKIYTSQADFYGAISAPGVDTYDDLPIAYYNTPANRTAGAYSYTVSSEGGLYGAGTAGDHWLSNNDRTQSIVFSGFSPGVTAFGGNFFGSDINGQFVTNTSVTLTALSGASISYTLGNTTIGSFLGFISDSPLSSITLNSQGAYWPTANNVTLGMAAPVTSVPEPATWAMMILGFGAVGSMARSARRRNALSAA